MFYPKIFGKIQIFFLKIRQNADFFFRNAKGFSLYFFFSHTDFFPQILIFFVIYTDFVLDQSGRSEDHDQFHFFHYIHVFLSFILKYKNMYYLRVKDAPKGLFK